MQPPHSTSLTPPPFKVDLFCWFSLIGSLIEVLSFLWQQSSPYVPPPVPCLQASNQPVPQSAGLPTSSSISSFPTPHPPVSTYSAAATHLTSVNMSTASAAAFSHPVPSFAVTSDPLPVSTFSGPPNPSAVPVCAVSGTGPSCASTVPSSSNPPPVVSSHAYVEPPLRFSFEEMNIPDLYASFKSLFKTIRERGGSVCKYDTFKAHFCSVKPYIVQRINLFPVLLKRTATPWFSRIVTLPHFTLQLCPRCLLLLHWHHML